jgi:nitrate reductase molybdenum cofactor assembly chaperone NarJ/NarW
VSPLPGVRPRRRTPVDDRGCALTLQAVSVLLGYPDDALMARLPLVEGALHGLPERSRGRVERMCRHLRLTPLDVLQQAYVETFDLRRRCALYLTYFTHGDTRKRGMALLRFTHLYRSTGVELGGEELPDHLGVVCEFAATGDLDAGLRLLAENRAGIELLRTALHELTSPYTDVLDALRAVLPDPAPRDLEKALELARTGPPEEEVGLEPFGPPELMGGRR